MVQSHAGPGTQTRWEKPRAQLLANLDRWKQRRQAAGGDSTSAAAGAGGSDFWEINCKVGYQQSPAVVPAAGGIMTNRNAAFVVLTHRDNMQYALICCYLHLHLFVVSSGS